MLVLILAWAPLPKHEILFGAISLALATTVQIIITGPFYTAAHKGHIFFRMIEIDLLIVISTTAAYVYFVIAYGYLTARKPLSTGQFFETSTLLVTLIMVGRATPVALLVDPEMRGEEMVDARLLQYGDNFKVLPDEKLSLMVWCWLGNQKSMNPCLIVKGPGQAVIAGSLNHSETLVVRLTRLPGETPSPRSETWSTKRSHPKIQQIADRVAAYFVPFILAITTIVFFV